MKIIAFDLETAKEAPEDYTDPHAYNLGITCAAGRAVDDGDTVQWVSWAADAGKVMSPHQAVEIFLYLAEMAAQGYYIVTVNGCGFDFRVLEAATRPVSHEIENLLAYTIQELAWLHHIDVAYQCLCEKGFMIGSAKLAQGLGVSGKLDGMDGMDAVRLWATGREEDRQKCIAYVERDAEMEADIYHALVEAGKIRWITGRGYLSKPWYPLVMVEGKQLRSFNAPTVDPSRKRLLTAAEATDLVLPDVAWMSDPWPREKFTGWITETCNE